MRVRTRALLAICCIALAGSSAASGPTTAQQLRSEISPQDLKALRKNMAEIKSPIR